MIDAFTIAQVEQATGIPKDLLRMWERRYGFPQPARDAQGDRVYTRDDLGKLDLIRRLMEQGRRPGKLVGLSADTLQQLYSEGMAKESMRLQELVPLLRSSDFLQSRDWLETRLHSQGLRRFVCETLPQLNQIVGDAWEAGHLGVHDEHLYTEQINNLLRAAIATLPASAPEARRFLLTTLPGEQHGLGLLMVEALLRQRGDAVISLGTETPRDDIVRAAMSHQVHVVALSFSITFTAPRAQAELVALRQQLPDHIALWAGGAALQSLPPIDQVMMTTTLDAVMNTSSRSL